MILVDVFLFKDPGARKVPDLLDPGPQHWFYMILPSLHSSCFSIVNDMIFGYHIFLFFSWTLLHVFNVCSFIIVYSLYLELTGISKLEDMAKVKVRKKEKKKD